MKKPISDLRRDYRRSKLEKSSLSDNPLKQLEHWLSEAIEADVKEPTAMTLATSSEENRPSARIVLLKGINEKGLYFYTNYSSRKGMEISGNPFVAAVLFWTELERQVRIEGKAVKLSGEESAEYFNSRPFESRISAAVSPQSREIPDRKYLEEKFESYRKSLKNENVPRPENWGGFLIIPDKIEFWQGRENRLHDRILYTKNGENWAKLRLAP